MKSHPNTFIDAELAREIMEWSVVAAGEEEWLEKAILQGERLPIFAYWPEGGTIVVMDGIDPTKTREFRPTSNIEHAMEVLAEVKKKEWKVVITGGDKADDGDWKIELYHFNESRRAEGPLAVETSPDNPALAISKAVLHALRALQKEAP